MLIDPDFLDHWRTRDLVDALGNDEMAPTYLIRLWGHCQIRKSDTFAIPTKGLRLICRYEGDAERLESALIEAGWIERDGDNIRALKWLDHNRGLSKAWENGQRGGRPKKPDGNRMVTGCEPDANRMQTGRKPIGLDRIGQDQILKSNTPPAAVRCDDEALAKFAAWWAGYPIRKPGVPRGNRKKALAIWLGMTEAERADVVRATAGLIASGQMPKDGQTFLKPEGKNGDPPYFTWLEDTAGAVVASGGQLKPTVAQVQEARNHPYDSSWLATPKEAK